MVKCCRKQIDISTNRNKNRENTYSSKSKKLFLYFEPFSWRLMAFAHDEFKHLGFFLLHIWRYLLIKTHKTHTHTFVLTLQMACNFSRTYKHKHTIQNFSHKCRWWFLVKMTLFFKLLNFLWLPSLSDTSSQFGSFSNSVLEQLLKLLIWRGFKI